MVARNWVEVVGLITVVLSLLFVGLELRQSSEIATVEASQALLQMNQELAIAGYMEPDMAALTVKAREHGLDSLSTVEAERYFSFVRAQINIWEQAFYSHSRGVLNDDQWQNWHTSYCDLLDIVWYEALNKTGFIPEFISLVEECYVRAKQKRDS